MSTAAVLLLLGAATVGVIHSILPDHWAPLAVVARTQRWSLGRVARVSLLAAGGHVLTSLVLAGVIALVGLQFQHQIERQQGHIVGGLLLVSGAAFLLWGLTGRGHLHEHRWHSHEAGDHAGHDQHDDDDDDHRIRESHPHEEEPHQHEHVGAAAVAGGPHAHEHVHGGSRHSHRHNHQAFIQHRANLMAERSARRSLVGTLAALVVPFGVAASPDLTFLPVAAAATAYGSDLVAAVLVVFATFTVATFVGLTVVATAAGYQMKGEWLEENANTITSVVLIAIGIVAFVGL